VKTNPRYRSTFVSPREGLKPGDFVTVDGFGGLVFVRYAEEPGFGIGRTPDRRETAFPLEDVSSATRVQSK
jgi:hypothetical protein